MNTVKDASTYIEARIGEIILCKGNPFLEGNAREMEKELADYGVTLEHTKDGIRWSREI